MKWTEEKVVGGGNGNCTTSGQHATCNSFLRPTFFALLSWPSVLISDSVSLTSHQGMFGCPRKCEKKKKKESGEIMREKKNGDRENVNKI